MHKEINFENDIEQVLISSGGYAKGDPKSYDPDIALFPAETIAFVQKTQAKIWARLTQLDSSKAEALLLDSLVKELAAKGSLAVLREGFKCVGKTVRIAYFAPNTGKFQASCRLNLKSHAAILFWLGASWFVVWGVFCVSV